MPAFAPLALGLGSTLLGGFLGRGSERRTLDPAQLRELFGPQALASDTQELYRLLANSPAFSQMMSAGALRGQQVAQRSQASLAARGISGSGIGAFLSAAGTGLGGTLQRQGQAQLFQRSLSAAIPLLQQRANLFGRSFLQRQGQPTFQRMIGSSLLSAGSAGLSSLFNQPKEQGFGGGFGADPNPFGNIYG